MAEEEKKEREEKNAEDITEIEEALSQEESREEKSYEETDIEELIEAEESEGEDPKKENPIQRLISTVKANKLLVVGIGAGAFLLLSIFLFFSGGEEVVESQTATQAQPPALNPAPQPALKETTPSEEGPETEIPIPSTPQGRQNTQPPIPPEQGTLSYIPSNEEEIGVPIPTNPPPPPQQIKKPTMEKSTAPASMPLPSPKITLHVPVKKPKAKIELELPHIEADTSTPKSAKETNRIVKEREEAKEKKKPEAEKEEAVVKRSEKKGAEKRKPEPKAKTKKKKSIKKVVQKKTAHSRKTAKKPPKREVTALSVLEIYEGMFFKALDGNNYWEGDEYKGMKIIKIKKGYVVFENGTKRVKAPVKRESYE